MSETAEESLRRAVDALPLRLRRHIYRTLDEGLRLAARHAVDAAKVRLAVLGHDLCRVTPPPDLVSLATALGLAPNEAERASPILLHGPLAACLLQQRFGIGDTEVLDAVRYHMTGRAGMSGLEKVLFLADKTEPRKLAHYPERRPAHRLARTDLDAAMAALLALYVEQAQREGWPLHSNVLAAHACYVTAAS